jgi:hypothetical protein
MTAAGTGPQNPRVDERRRFVIHDLWGRARVEPLTSEPLAKPKPKAKRRGKS